MYMDFGGRTLLWGKDLTTYYGHDIRNLVHRVLSNIFLLQYSLKGQYQFTSKRPPT